MLKSLGASRAERGGGNAGCDQATHTCAPETAALSPFASNLLTFVSAAYTLLVLFILCQYSAYTGFASTAYTLLILLKVLLTLC